MAIEIYYNRFRALMDGLCHKIITGPARIMRSAALAMGLCLCCSVLMTGFAAQMANAMPATKEDEGRAKPIRSGFAFDTPFKPSVSGQLANPYDDLFRELAPPDRDFYRLDKSGKRLALTKEETAAFGKLVSPAEGVDYGNAFGLEQPYQTADHSARDILLQHFEADIDSLYNDFQIHRQAGSPKAFLQTGDEQRDFEAGSRVLRVVPSRRANDLPLLSAIPLGAVFLDSVKSLVKETGFSEASLSSLRDFVFVQQPENSSIMMVDSGTGYTVMLHSNEQGLLNNRPDSGFGPVLEQHNSNNPMMTSSFDHRPLHLRIWDFLTSTSALVIYAMIIICWGAWRYVISRYV